MSYTVHSLNYGYDIIEIDTSNRAISRLSHCLAERVLGILTNNMNFKNTKSTTGSREVSKRGKGNYKLVSTDDSGGQTLMNDGLELVGNTAEKKNWKGIFIALLVIVVVISLVIVAIVLLSPGPTDEDQREKLTFDNIFDRDFHPKYFHHTWLQAADEDIFLYRDNDGALYMFNCAANESSPDRRIQLMDNKTFRELNSQTFHVSPDRKFVLIQHDETPVFRYSKLSRYSIYSLVHGNYVPFNPPFASGPKFQYVGWAPFGHSLVYIQQNNIFYIRDPGHGTNSKPVQVTTDGEPGVIYSGVPDWVYEEEILGTDNAIWWSPDGRFLLFAVFNDSEVRQYYYPFYGDMRNQYGEERRIAYPKPGHKNPTISIKVYDTLKNKTVLVPPPSDFKDIEYYFTTVAWSDNDFFLVSYLNRPQNLSIIMACKAVNGVCKVNEREDGKGGWVSIYRPPVFSKDGDRYFWILPRREGSSGMYNQVAMVEFPVSKTQQLTNREGLKVFVTGGTMDVMEIVGYDPLLDIIYYIAAPDPKERHLYSVNCNSSDPNYRHQKCLTCEYDKLCQYVSASFSASGRYYMLECQGPGVPYYVLKSTLNDDEVVFEGNEDLKKRMLKLKLPRVEYFKIKISEHEYLHGKLLLPPQLKPDEIITYPLLLSVYGGPDTQMVTKRFVPLDWETHLCSSNGIIIGYVDARGTSARGLSFLHAVYKRLGTVEVADTIAAGNFFDQLPYVESSKKAIWGVSYGGYLTISALASRDPPNPFDCGIAVAPVTDWNYYDSVYTERYMNTIQDNPEGYRFSNLSRHATHFKNSNFMLIHGTGDDNVHFQNSAQLMKALVEANVFFRSQIYTDQGHNLNGGNTKRHLYETMEDFLNECFHGKSRKFELKTKLLQQTKQEPIDSK